MGQKSTINAVERFTEIHGKQTHGFTLRVIYITTDSVLHTEERVYTDPPLSCRQTELSSDVAQQWPKRECYTQTSQMRVQLQGYVDSSVVYLSLGNVNLGERGHVSSFPRWGPVLNLRNNFQILQIKGLQISAWSLHTQNGMRSGPVAVFLRCCKQFHTCLSEISGAWTPLSTWRVALISALFWFINYV